MQPLSSLSQRAFPNSPLLQVCQNPLFNKALEALKLKACNRYDLIELELKFSTCREMIREYAKDISITDEKIQWYKRCLGWHEIKLDGKLKKKKAQEIARKTLAEYQKNPVYSEIKTEIRGKYDPLILFKHVDNCPLCDSKPIRVFQQVSPSALELLDDFEKQLNCSELEVEGLYEKMAQFVFYKER